MKKERQPFSKVWRDPVYCFSRNSIEIKKSLTYRFAWHSIKKEHSLVNWRSFVTAALTGKANSETQCNLKTDLAGCGHYGMVAQETNLLIGDDIVTTPAAKD